MSIASTLGSIVGVILKIIVVIFMIPLIAFGICVVAGLGVSLALLIKGFAVFGLVFIALGSALCLFALIWAVFKAIFGRGDMPEAAKASAFNATQKNSADDSEGV